MASCPATSPLLSKTPRNLWCRTCKAWEPTCDHPSKTILCLEACNHPAIAGVLKHHRAGTIGNRATTEMMVDGIDYWLTNGVDSSSTDEQQRFVDFVWHYMRERQRELAQESVKEKETKAFLKAKRHLSQTYDDFPEEEKDDSDLMAMYIRLGKWSLVVSSEQQRIASKKKHDKEERLIENKFGGDRAAYNRFKRINERTSQLNVREVSHQLMTEFAEWMENNPNYFNPGSRCVAVETSLFHIKNPTNVHHYQSNKKNIDVSATNMVTAIGSLMTEMESGRIEVTLEFERSPHQYTMSDKYPLLVMHGCNRLISGSKHAIIAIHKDKLVLEARSSVVKRLPQEYHKSFSGICEQDGLFKSLMTNNVIDIPDITRVECTGFTKENHPIHVVLRQTTRSNCSFDVSQIQMTAQKTLVNNLRIAAKQKKKAAQSARIEAIRKPLPPSPSSSPSTNIAKELMELGKLFKDGLLTKNEFSKAKTRLL